MGMTGDLFGHYERSGANRRDAYVDQFHLLILEQKRPYVPLPPRAVVPRVNPRLTVEGGRIPETARVAPVPRPRDTVAGPLGIRLVGEMPLPVPRPLAAVAEGTDTIGIEGDFESIS